jgi:hypothetical protein
MTDEGQTLDDELSEIESLRHEKQRLEEEKAKYLKTIGDQGNQIGDMRHIIAQQMEQTQTDDWDYDPQEKEIRELKNKFTQLEQSEAIRKLEEQYPGFRELPQNEEFNEWIQGSPVRSALYSRANGMDLAAANEMLALWQERQKIAEELQQQGTTKRRQALRNATMEKGSGGGERKQYYTHQELQELRGKPDEWAARWPEIQQAYAEGRVK